MWAASSSLPSPSFKPHDRLWVVYLLLSPSCVTKENPGKKWLREILGARPAQKEGLLSKPRSLIFYESWYYVGLTMCMSRKYPYSPNRRDWNFLGGGGFCKTQKFKGMCEALLEFLEGLGGAGLRKKSLLWGRYGYFLELHNTKIWLAYVRSIDNRVNIWDTCNIL